MAATTTKEVVCKWLLFILLAASMPVLYFAPMVGTYPTSYVILTAQGMLLIGAGPFFVMALLQVVGYGLLLYALSRLLAKFLCTSHNKGGKAALVLLLIVNVVLAVTTPIYGFGYNASMLDLYLETFR